MIPMIELKSELEGIIKLEIIKEDGTLKQGKALNIPFKNLITNIGLDYLSSGNTIGAACQYCKVGTGSTAPSVNDTSLASKVGSTSPAGTITNSVQTSVEPYYSQHKTVYTFSIGAVVGNLTEIGFFSDSSGGTMWSRALIKDSGGNPTVLTLLATEQLKVTYTVIRYFPASATGSFTLNTNGVNSTINYTIKPSNVYWMFKSGFCSSNTMSIYAYETNILGGIGVQPSGAYAEASSTSNNYITGTFERSSTTVFGPSIANYTTGIGSIVFWCVSQFGTYYTGYQCSFSPKIMKTSSQTLAIGIRLSWGRTTQQ